MHDSVAESVNHFSRKALQADEVLGGVHYMSVLNVGSCLHHMFTNGVCNPSISVDEVVYQNNLTEKL